MAAFKSAPQILGLTREAHPRGRHRASGMGVCLEAGAERASKSNTLDRTMSDLNIYEGFEKGRDCWEAMCSAADEYRSHYIDKNGREVNRKLRSNAVIGYALVLKAPCDICRHWDNATYAQFYDDCFECLHEIEPRLFRKSTIRMKAEHFDEGIAHDGRERHIHVIGDCIDENGNYVGKLIDHNLLVAINERFPELMRAKGWEMEDLDTTDWKRYNNDPEYAKERDKVMQENGLDTNKYALKAQDKVIQQWYDTFQSVYENDKAEKNAELDAEIAQKKAEKEAELDAEIAQKRAEKEAELDVAMKQKRAKSERKIAYEYNKRKKEQDDRERALDAREKMQKEAALISYQVSVEYHDKMLDKVNNQVKRINSMTLDDNAVLKFIKEKDPDLYTQFLESEKEYKASLQKSLEMPAPVEAPDEAIKEAEKEIKQEAEHIKDIQRQNAERNQTMQKLEAENKKLKAKKRPTVEQPRGTEFDGQIKPASDDKETPASSLPEA